MEYDMRQDPCVCVDGTSRRLVLYYYYYTTTIRPPTSSQDMEVWIMTLTIYDHWIMTMSCSQVCGCCRSLYYRAHAPTLHRTPVAVYVLLSVCYALHRCRSASMLLL